MEGKLMEQTAVFLTKWFSGKESQSIVNNVIPTSEQDRTDVDK